MRLARYLVVVALLSMLIAGTVGAYPILQLDSRLYGQGVSFWYKGTNYSGVWAGSMAARLDGVSLPGIYCVDLDNWINIPTSYPVVERTTQSLTYGARAAWLYNSFGQTTMNQRAAALQLALWDVVYDNGDGLTTGFFRYSGGLAGQTGIYLNASLGQSDRAAYYDPVGNQQAFVGPIPEPATGVLLIMGGALALTPLAKRRKRT